MDWHRIIGLYLLYRSPSAPKITPAINRGLWHLSAVRTRVFRLTTSLAPSRLSSRSSYHLRSGAYYDQVCIFSTPLIQNCLDQRVFCKKQHTSSNHLYSLAGNLVGISPTSPPPSPIWASSIHQWEFGNYLLIIAVQDVG